MVFLSVNYMLNIVCVKFQVERASGCAKKRRKMGKYSVHKQPFLRMNDLVLYSGGRALRRSGLLQFNSF